jgi:hypothetical protein
MTTRIFYLVKKFRKILKYEEKEKRTHTTQKDVLVVVVTSTNSSLVAQKQ